jgi:hypothetical protein
MNTGICSCTNPKSDVGLWCFESANNTGPGTVHPLQHDVYHGSSRGGDLNGVCSAQRTPDLHYAYRICIMKIEFDPGKAAENLRKHRVSFAHAEQALSAGNASKLETLAYAKGI